MAGVEELGSSGREDNVSCAEEDEGRESALSVRLMISATSGRAPSTLLMTDVRDEECVAQDDGEGINFGSGRWSSLE